jgi:adenosylmethionine-8-amino-7-oxononanoate aminotransferase
MSKSPPADPIVALDRAHVWHPFTPFDTWMSPDFEMLSIVRAKGSTLHDQHGRRYLDGNSSIWVNLHGHRCAPIDRAIKAQLDRVAHTSFLGLTNDRAPDLAARLVRASNRGRRGPFARVFLSDDGSTAIEAGVKIVFQGFRLRGEKDRTTFVNLAGGYHGDTVGAMSVGQSDLFHGAYKPLLFPSESAMAPHCYRCPYNRAKPDTADARTTRKCHWECVGEFRKAVKNAGRRFAGAVVEPLVQGAAGMIMHPSGYLAQTAEIVRAAGGRLILDEVMTGFFRTGKMFAHFHENVRPDVLALAKGLTAGYLPLAATLVTDEITEPFQGGIERTFYHGHSYSGNQLGCAAALANLDLLEAPKFAPRLALRIREMETLRERFWQHPDVGDVRQTGLILAVELVRNRRTREPFPAAERIGWKVSEACRRFGLLTRPIGNTLLLMPRLNVTAAELRRMITALEAGLHDALPPARL